MALKDNGSDLDFEVGYNEFHFSERVLRIDIVGSENQAKRRHKKIHISSMVLAAKSPFFFKLFSDGMKESDAQHVTLRIDPSEEVALMDLLNFMHSNTLSSATTSSLLQVLMLADKFMVSSCIKYCIDLLRHLPMTTESAVEILHHPLTVTIADQFQPLIHAAKEYLARFNDALSATTNSSLLQASSLLDLLKLAEMFQSIHLVCDYPMTTEAAVQILHLASTVLQADQFQPLIHAAKDYLADYYEDFSEFPEEEVIELPLAAIEAILSSDDLIVAHEDDVYEFILKWARKHYPMIKERQEILTNRLTSLIRFKNMTCEKLKEILSCNDFYPAYASKVVVEALLFKTECTHLHTFHASRRFSCRPVKVLKSMFPYPHCIVYLDLRKEECDDLLPSHGWWSEDFCIGEMCFSLFAGRYSDHFGVFLKMSGKQSVSCSVAYEFSARSKPTKEFVSLGKKKLGDLDSFVNSFEVSWSQFIASDSIYFIDEVLYLKAEIAMM